MRLCSRHTIYASLIIILGWFLSSCGAATPTETRPIQTISPSFIPTITSIPTVTPSPTSPPPSAILLASTGADPLYVNSLQSALNDIVTAAGLQWQVRQSLSMDDLVPSLRLVVITPPNPGLDELVAGAPNTQFLALDIPDLNPAPNLTQIEAGNRPDQQGFIAGIIAAIVAPDWRVGTISLSDTVEGRAARTGFLNGVEYFCGLCRPAHPPLYEYPLYVELPTTATAPEWLEAANFMVDHFAQTVYIYPGAGDETMLSTLAEAGIKIISNGEPPQALSKSWVVSLTTDPLHLVQRQVKGLLEGSISGGQSLVVPIEFTHLNPTIFSPGKQRLVGEILADLQSGYIDTRVDLTTGENRP